MIIFKENVPLRRKPEVTIDEESKRISDLMVEAMVEDTQEVDNIVESVTISETFRIPGTSEILEKGTVISISK